jgi:hypothetical protein
MQDRCHSSGLAHCLKALACACLAIGERPMYPTSERRRDCFIQRLPRPKVKSSAREKKEGEVWIGHDYWVVHRIQLKGEIKRVWYNMQFGRIRIDSHVFIVFHSILCASTFSKES